MKKILKLSFELDREGVDNVQAEFVQATGLLDAALRYTSEEVMQNSISVHSGFDEATAEEVVEIQGNAAQVFSEEVIVRYFDVDSYNIGDGKIGIRVGQCNFWASMDVGELSDAEMAFSGTKVVHSSPEMQMWICDEREWDHVVVQLNKVKGY